MSGRQYTVYEFAKLTPFQKDRLKERDPVQYEKLLQQTKQELPMDSEGVSSDDVTLRDR